MGIRIEVSPGELLDKLTILEIKEQRIDDAAKLRNVSQEKSVLESARQEHIARSADVDALTDKLRAVNERLWDIEDDIRDHERNADFGAGFVDLARSVYRMNDERAAVKKQINELLGSDLVEEKSYAEY